MHRTAAFAPLLALILLAACSEAPVPGPSNESGPAARPAEAPAAAAASQTGGAAMPHIEALPFASALAEGTPYAEARQAVLAAGWLPLVTPSCAENVGGEARICLALPELEACSGTGAGFCRMAFGRDDGALALSLLTVGGHADWAAVGEAATMRLDAATVEHVSPSADRLCPSAEFETFLEAFAGEPTVRAAWTAPLVRAAFRYERGEDSVVVDGLVRAAEFGGFPVLHQAGAFHHVDADGAVDPTPLALRITEPDPDTRDVAFDYGLSEGNRVRFTRVDGCWQLNADPEPPVS